MTKHCRNMIACPICKKTLKIRESTECLGCLGLFHASCLKKVRRVLEDGSRGRTSYFLCRKCLESQPLERYVLLESQKYQGEVGVAARAS